MGSIAHSFGQGTYGVPPACEEGMRKRYPILERDAIDRPYCGAISLGISSHLDPREFQVSELAFVILRVQTLGFLRTVRLLRTDLLFDAVIIGHPWSLVALAFQVCIHGVASAWDDVFRFATKQTGTTPTYLPPDIMIIASAVIAFRGCREVYCHRSVIGLPGPRLLGRWSVTLNTHGEAGRYEHYAVEHPDSLLTA